MNSFAHYSFGAVGEWMFKTIGGIDTDGPAYEHIIIRPQPGGRLTWAKTTYDSIHGPIATAWRTMPESPSGREFRLYVTIPANTTARVYVPTRRRRQRHGREKARRTGPGRALHRPGEQ